MPRISMSVSLDIESASYINTKQRNDPDWNFSEKVRDMVHEMIEEDEEYESSGEW